MSHPEDLNGILGPSTPVAVRDPIAEAFPDPSEFLQPVRITFLARIFRTEPRRLEKKLLNCPVIRWEMHKGVKVPVYNFIEAASYIIPPRVDIGTWIRTQTPHSLPVAINKSYWEAENSRLRWMERARHVWHDEDVLDVLGRTALIIKETSQLWIENLPGKAVMTTEQFEALQVNVSALLDEIHTRLVEIPKARRSESVLREMDALTAPVDDDDDDL